MANLISNPNAKVALVRLDGSLSINGLRTMQQMANAINGSQPYSGVSLIGLGNGMNLYVGAGSPEGVVTDNPGAMYLNSEGGSGTTLYVKETGSGNTGWTAK